MLKESSFTWALSLSIVGHASLLMIASSRFNATEHLTPTTEDVEITYFEIRDIPKEGTPPVVQTASGVMEPPTSFSLPLSPDRGRPPDSVEIPKPKLVERSVARQDGTEKEKNLSTEEALYQEMTSKLQDPVFATYYQAIREKIRKAAKRRYEGKRDSGDVSLGFTLFSNGRLKEASVFRKTSQAASNLGVLAVQSLVDASPFPPFPGRFEREQLSFLVVLTFEPKP